MLYYKQTFGVKKNLLVKSIGGQGYVKVEFLGDTYYVEPDTEEQFFVPVGTDYKITRSIVNPDTGLLDANRIDISFPNYKFPARFVSASFDGVAENGVTNPSFADENGIQKLREHTKTMQVVASAYVVEINFRELTLLDIDLENPNCYDDANAVAVLRDTKNLVVFNHPTPSRRFPVVNGALRSFETPYLGNSHLGGYGGDGIFRIPFTTYAMFTVQEINKIGTDQRAGVFGRNLDGSSTGIANHSGSHIVTAFSPDFFNCFGATTNPNPTAGNTFGRHNYQAGLNANYTTGYTTVPFNIRNNLNKKIGYTIRNADQAKMFIDNTTYLYTNTNTHFQINGNSPIWIHPNNFDGRASLYRAIVTDRITSNEYTILGQKIKDKYNL